MPDALARSSAAGVLGGRDSIPVGMQGWDVGRGQGHPGKCLSFSLITENQGGFFFFFMITVIIILEKKPSTGRGGLCCSHLSGFTSGTGCDTWNLEVQGSHRTWSQCIGRKGKFLGDRWITLDDMFQEGGGWVCFRKSWAFAAGVGKKDSFRVCTSINNSVF